MTGPGQVIAQQVVDAGNTLMLALEPVGDDEFYAENANGFSAAWVVGHLAGFADLFSSLFDGRLTLSSEFHKVFNDTAIAAAGPASKAGSVDRDLYPKADLLLALRRAVWSKRCGRCGRSVMTGGMPRPRPGHRYPCAPQAPRGVRLGMHICWHNGELAGSMPRFFGTYTLNIEPHYFHDDGSGQ